MNQNTDLTVTFPSPTVAAITGIASGTVAAPAPVQLWPKVAAYIDQIVTREDRSIVVTIVDAEGQHVRTFAPKAPTPPTVSDLLSSRPAAAPAPAETGLRGLVRTLSGGAIKPAPSQKELRLRTAVDEIQRSLPGPRTIVVINPKGGAHKTTATLMIAATFGRARGGYTLAWDNNETRGTLGWRAAHSWHTNTAVNLLHDLDRFNDVSSARVGDLDNYVRGQGDDQFDVLASDEDAAASSTIDADAFNALHRTLARFYRVIVVDTGNNMRASNWQAAIDAADELVVVTTIREDTGASAAWLIDALRATGHEDKLRNAVTIIADAGQKVDTGLEQRLHDHFAALTREVVRVPYDPEFVDGGSIDTAKLAQSTLDAWTLATAATARGL